MASITIKYEPNLSDDPALSDIGWLWTLRIYASGKIPLNFESSWPVHLLPLIERYATDNQEKESVEFKYEFLANELDRLGNAQTISNSHLALNLRMVADSFNLSDIERQILEFRTIYRVHNGLEQTVDLISARWTDNLIHQIIGHALDVPTTIIADALSPESKLIKSGLLIMHRSIQSDFGRKLIALDGFVNGVQSFRTKTLDIFGFLFNKATGTTLNLNNFTHHKDDIEIIIKYLAQCLKYKSVGVNILLHGVPGVGKTELARLISQELEITAYEVSSSDSDDENDQPPSRFKSYLILQNLISQMDSGLVIFDEIEDVLPRLGLLDRPSNGHKAWINNLLETNQSPSIWISNHVNQIDPAILRRFDFILEVKNPPSEQRVEIIKQSLGSLETSEQWISNICEMETVSPAIITRILKTIDVAKVSQMSEIRRHFERQIKERNVAQGYLPKRQYPKPIEFDSQLLNTDTDCIKLINRIGHITSAKILMYGPPGSGKTALAHHLAEQTGRRLLQKRSSDISSPFVGETEMNLKKMFDEANESDYVILLDEADSFLQSRSVAKHQWELTQVNELLTQIENYQGIMICATNFLEHLDQAALRRFQFKIQFKYLSIEQAKTYFIHISKKVCSDFQLPPENGVVSILNSLNNLTPSDFQTVIEQSEILDSKITVLEFAQELKLLSGLKSNQLQTIGFLH